MCIALLGSRVIPAIAQPWAVRVPDAEADMLHGIAYRVRPHLVPLVTISGDRPPATRSMTTTVTPEIDWTLSWTAAMQESQIIPSTAYMAVVMVKPLDVLQLPQCSRPGWPRSTLNTDTPLGYLNNRVANMSNRR